ncbi:hypothetical protein ACJ6WF_06180 [Streptomyces sp. MMS24-I2-30]|uniref:hypothetical protein n=1 Tax=Streptomyces sp. MMS24-I2-30 TaxID=3351564 RepID=UPI0038968BBE
MDLEQELAATRLELARLRAGLAAGLTPAQSAFLRGNTDEEIAADIQVLSAEFGVSNRRPSSGSGSDVRGFTGGSLNAGEARYRQDHGLDEDGRRPEEVRNPFQTNSYSMER